MGRSIKNTLVIISFVASIIMLVAAAMPAFAVDEAQVPSKEVQYDAPKGPLSVPVFPRGTNSEKKLPEGADLRDSYIILEDGSVLSAADWIVGSLKKDQSGMGMSDYENRLFLGQVARAAVGMDENLVNRSLVHANPTLAYKAAPAPKGIEAAALSLASLVVNTILPGTPEGYDPSKVGGAFSPTMKARGDSTLLFDEWFNESMNQTVAEFKEAGTMQIMRNEQQKKLKENISKKLRPKKKYSPFTFSSQEQDDRRRR
ncbi:MAG: hypothetical protein AB3N28_09965 [Kordiimonas sp.]